MPRGAPTFAVALGAAVGEAIGDILEGYEINDPLGFAGYFIGFAVAGSLIAGRPLNWVRVTIACIVGAFVQAAIEASSFLIFGEEGVDVAVYSALGNTLTHGIVLGAIVTIPLIYALHGRIERFLGYAPMVR